jgi:hypothetical protein
MALSMVAKAKYSPPSLAISRRAVEAWRSCTSVSSASMKWRAMVWLISPWT